MYEKKFSNWTAWGNRNYIKGICYPGVYAIAHSISDISNTTFFWREEIIYIGMTNAVHGLKGRLKQFDNTIAGKKGHGGADRVHYKYENYNELVKNLYASVSPVKCDVRSNKPCDLRKMGEVAKFEYLCLAQFVEEFKRLPEFNDKMRSPKYSLTKGRNKQ